MLWAIVNIILLGLISPVQRSFHLSGNAQGTTWSITYYHNDSIVSKVHIDSIFQKIDSSLSIYRSYSLIVAFNKSERGIKADEHLQNVISRSVDMYNATNGLSDITVAPLVEAWGFGASEYKGIPTDNEVHHILQCVGLKYITLKNDSLIKLKPCVTIDVNGIAQGYTVDVIGKYLESKGICNYIVELGGEVRVKGKKQPGEQPFRIGIETPSDDVLSEPFQEIIVIPDGAITTSGNYRKFHENKGKKYSHIIDPRTGKSVNNEMISVTVYAKDATTADGLDNALLLMGVEKATRFIEERSGLAAFFIYTDSNGKVSETATSRFKLLFDPGQKR